MKTERPAANDVTADEPRSPEAIKQDRYRIRIEAKAAGWRFGSRNVVYGSTAVNEICAFGRIGLDASPLDFDEAATDWTNMRAQADKLARERKKKKDGGGGVTG